MEAFTKTTLNNCSFAISITFNPSKPACKKSSSFRSCRAKVDVRCQKSSIRLVAAQHWNHGTQIMKTGENYEIIGKKRVNRKDEVADLRPERTLECGEAQQSHNKLGINGPSPREQGPLLDDENRSTVEFCSPWASLAGARSPLTRDEEISLTLDVQDMLQLERRKGELEKELGRAPTVEEWAQNVQMSVFKLYARIGKGRAAKRKMVAANIRLVNSVADQFHGRGLSHVELCQEGVLSLLKSSEKYDSSYNTKFSTYSFMAIWKKMSEAVKKFQHVLRISRTVYETASIILKQKEEFISFHGRQPSLQELSELTLVDKDRIREVLRIVSPANSMEKTTSTLENDHETEIEDQDRDGLPWTHILETELKTQVAKALGSLTSREEMVLQMRYGLGGEPPKPRSEVGLALNLSNESIRLIEKKALDKLREIAKEDGLQHYLSRSSWFQ